MGTSRAKIYLDREVLGAAEAAGHAGTLLNYAIAVRIHCWVLVDVVDVPTSRLGSFV